MTEYPMTPKQEQEMRAVAQRAIQKQPGVFSIVPLAIRLASFIFKDGRISDTVSFQERCRIAQEELARQSKESE